MYEHALSFAHSVKNILSGKGSSRTGKLIGLILGPLLLITVLNAPIGLTTGQLHLLSLICLVMTYWITRALPIPVTSIMALGMAVVLNIAPAQVVFSAVASPTMFLLIGGFIMTRSMTKYGLGHRIALAVLSLPGVARSTYRIIVMLGLLAVVLTSVMDNGAVAAMLVPIGVGLISTLEDDVRGAAGLAKDGSRLRFGTAVMLIIAYGATVGALLTPFGDGSVLIGWYFLRTQFHMTVPVDTWMQLSIPIVCVLFLLMCGAVLLLNRPEVRKLDGATETIRQRRQELGPMSRGEINTAIAFATAVTLWMLPSVAGLVFGHGSSVEHWIFKRLNPAAVATLAAVLLFVLPLGNGRGSTLRWRDTREMDWGPVLLMGSGLALATLMDKTGLAAIIGHTLANELTGIGAIGVYFFSAIVAVMFSELTSNFVSISILVPIIPTMALAGGGNPIVATLVATFSALYGFMLPISTTANVIVFGSGKIPFLKMLKTGLLVDLSSVIVVVVGIWTMTRVLGIG